MPEDKSVIGLTWQPNISCFTSSSSNTFNSDKQLPHVHGTTTAAATTTTATATTSLVYKPNSDLVDGLFLPPNDPKKLNKLFNKQLKDSAGKNWFDMPAPTITPELQKDLQLLKLRSAIDPKRHYKKGGSKSKTLPKYFQVGTVIEPATEFYTSRLTKKERKASLADELLSDSALGQYRKRKVQEIEEHNRPAGVDKWKIRGQHSRKRAKERRH